MTRPTYTSLPPAAKAQFDYMQGHGQECNPYQKHSNDWWAYSLAMQAMQQREFLAEQQETF